VHQRSIISQGYLTGLIIATLVIFSSGIITASLIIYYKTDKSLDIHYSAIISTLTTLKDSIFLLSLKISLLVSLLTLIGLLIIGIVYTHKIAGPLYRLKKWIEIIAKGEFTEKISFRKKDAIHTVGDAFNYMIDNIGKDIVEMKSEIRKIEEYLENLKDKSIDKNELLQHLNETEINIKSIINKYEI